MATEKRTFNVYFSQIIIGAESKSLIDYERQLFALAKRGFPKLEIQHVEYVLKSFIKDRNGFWRGCFARVNKDAPTILNITNKTEHVVPLRRDEFVQEQCFFVYDPERDKFTFMLNVQTGTETRLSLYIGRLIGELVQICRIEIPQYQSSIFNKGIYEAKVKVASLPKKDGAILPSVMRQMVQKAVNIGSCEVIIKAPKGEKLGPKAIKEFKELYGEGYNHMWIKQAADQDYVNLRKPSLKDKIHLRRMGDGEIDYSDVYRQLTDVYGENLDALGFDDDA